MKIQQAMCQRVQAALPMVHEPRAEEFLQALDALRDRLGYVVAYDRDLGLVLAEPNYGRRLLIESNPVTGEYALLDR